MHPDERPQGPFAERRSIDTHDKVAMTLFAREFECPSCGGAIRRENPASRSLSCPYCGQTSHLTDDSLKAVGHQHLLIDYGSMLRVGMRAKLRDTPFSVLGRLRLKYEDGFWDEWYVQLLNSGDMAWIQEDDGSFVLFKQRASLEGLPYESIAVGGFYDISPAYPEVFISSKGRAEVEGGEGELPFAIVPGDPADFVEGISNGLLVSVEVLPDECNVFEGTPFDLDEIEL